jgi:hypothetical protein
MDYITMNSKEREQAKVFQQVKEGIITKTEAAARLKLTPRWVRIKFKRYCESSDKGLVHKSRGKVSSKRWSVDQEMQLTVLLQGEWQGFGPTFAAEKLQEIYQIKVCREVVRKSMIKQGLWKPRQQRIKHRKRRDRKAMLGMLVQFDGSPHDWFEGRAERCTLLVYIDDATSQILWLEFAPSESEQAVQQATYNYVRQNGRPGAFYVDHGSAFHVNLNNPDNIKKTQWGRACGQLGIEIKHANSPQAKGRVERCNGTLQDRLIKEMRLAGISSMQAANAYLQSGDFIERHNKKFAVKPTQQGNAHRDCQGYDLDDIFSAHKTRILANDFTIAYEKKIFQLHQQQRTIIRPKNEIVVKTTLSGQISLWVRKTRLDFHEIVSKPIIAIKDTQCINSAPRRPHENSRRWASGLAPLRRPYLPNPLESSLKPAPAAVETR